MDELQQRLGRIRAELDRAARLAGRDPASVTLVAATKTQTEQRIRQAIAAGVRVCGENRVQEMKAHLAQNAYEGAQLHFIGHLQTNKVREVVGRVSLIHSVSSLRLLEAIHQRAQQLALVQDILLEVKLSGEPSKEGFSPQQLEQAVELLAQRPHVRLRGLMCIPPAARQPGDNRPYFSQLRGLAVDINRKMKDNETDTLFLSMGMSGDFADAVAEGATHIRIGTALFGPRPPMQPSERSQLP